MTQGRYAEGEHFQMYMQTENIPFGKYPKTKYELHIYYSCVYSFTTTCRDFDYCLNYMKDLADNWNTPTHKRAVVFMVRNGERTLIYQA